MNKIAQTFRDFFAPLSAAQRTMFVGLAVIVVTFVGSLFYWALAPSYTLLFGSLKSESAQLIVQELESRGIPYELKNSGRSIYVEGEKVDALRLELAPMGAVQSDMKGYELFDSNTLGMTDFMQQLNSKRALEGELARSINSLEQVESSRIHLVMPERSPFEQTTVKASASVILTLKNGRHLSNKHIKGITSLIAGSVKGLDASNVTIIDQEGNRLTKVLNGESDLASGNLRLKLERKTEAYLTQRGQTMLDRVLGPGNSIMRVAVEQSFDKLVKRSNKVDPSSRTLISEKRSEEVHNEEAREMVPIDEFTPIMNRGETVVTSTSDNESSTRTRNYEVTETEVIYKKARGEITRLSASVLINYKQTMQEGENGEQTMVQVPYPTEKIEELKVVIGSALGIQPERGDVLTIKQIKFWDPETVGPQGPPPMTWNNIFRWGLIAVAFAIIALLLNSLRKQMRVEEQGILPDSVIGENQQVYLSNAEQQSLEGMSEEEIEGFIEGQGQDNKKPMLKEKNYNLEEIVNLVELKPAKAAQVVRVMLIADED